MIDLRQVVNDPELQHGQHGRFTILRSVGSWGPGGWQDAKVSIPATGTVTAAGPRELQQLPEADRANESWLFHTTTELKVTRAGRETGVSDVLEWHGEQWRIVALLENGHRGYWRALAQSMSGK